ncbi:HAMP domain-containing histidine kinase [bacterium]|nr:HAMP domain-containing histidine kinase [bacterium]
MTKRFRDRSRVVFKKFSITYKILLFLGILLLVVFFFYYTREIREQILEYNKRVVNVYARLWALAVTQSGGGEQLNIIFEEVIQKCDFPMVFTNVEGNVQAWRNLSADYHSPPGDMDRKLQKEIDSIKKKNKPVPIYLGETNEILGYIYFGESRFIKWMRILPVIEIVLVVIFLIFGFILYGRLKSYEQQNIWFGMARETAHQLGTPLSSLLGWMELLQERIQKLETLARQQDAEAVEKTYSSLSPNNILEEMSNDIEVLNRIVVRFGKIGSTPELNPVDPANIAREVVRYLRGRLPSLKANVKLTESYDPVPMVKGNAQLLRWALENLIKNSIESVDPENGEISVSTRLDLEGKNVCFIVKDNGKGISSRYQKDIFSPGYTTKKRGWGLGLSLAKRIVEQHHDGKLHLLESKPNEKTTFVISLPISELEENKNENA